MTATWLVRGAYPPENCNARLGFNDRAIATNRILNGLGFLDARQKGKIVIVDLHDDGAHLAHKADWNFPQAKPGGASTWPGCSPRHHRAFCRAHDRVKHWRATRVFGETINFGYGHVRPWARKFRNAHNGLYATVERRYESSIKNRHRAIPEPVEWDLHWSSDLVKPPAPNALADDVQNGATSFTYLSQTTAHLSAPLYAERNSAVPLLGRMASTNRAFAEVGMLAGVDLPKEQTWLLSRTYYARCVSARKRFTISPPIAWAYGSLARVSASRTWSVEEVEGRVGAVMRERLEGYSAAWEAAERERIGKSHGATGLLERAIAGWKVALQAVVARLAFPALSSYVSAPFPLAAPATSSDGQVAVTGSGMYGQTFSRIDS
ncbi:hypothetical protein Rhopal_007306-T1 [Rhodotorula paludigena]|uniref:Uncharacterized protein n=1 Tax=Rhodotorula paludigena TaxID=86838 RepID=A0AAV5GXJ8_9BASI|nr:hypothetical protein Rhopal_007306-T1 [Rhodotorula paludigena]